MFKSLRVETKRAILNILLSNLKIKDKQISYSLRKPFDLIDSLNEKTPPKIGGVAIGDAKLASYEPVSPFLATELSISNLTYSAGINPFFNTKK